MGITWWHSIYMLNNLLHMTVRKITAKLLDGDEMTFAFSFYLTVEKYVWFSYYIL